MGFITYSDLTSKVSLFTQESIRKSAASSTGKQVFLSHSSKDHDYVPGVIKLFEEHGASTYTDDADKRLPSTPSQTTASVLRQTIKQLPRFVVLVSPNSKSSHWIPWELGLADAFKGIALVAVLPIAPTETEEEWAKTEYMGLYPRVYKLSSSYYVYDPRPGAKPWSLRDWLTTSWVR